jgi:hypothetical protein
VNARENTMTVTSTTDQVPGDHKVAGHRRLIKGLTVAVVILTLAVIGMAMWAISGAPESEASAPSIELDELVDDYFETWTDYDSDAFFDLVTEDYIWEWGDQAWDAEAKMAEVAHYEFVNFRVDFTSERLWSGEEPTYYVAQSHTSYTDTGFPGPDGVDSISVLKIVNQDGDYLIARHVFHR